MKTILRFFVGLVFLVGLLALVFLGSLAITWIAEYTPELVVVGLKWLAVGLLVVTIVVVCHHFGEEIIE